jgi:hypothetical protein
MKFGLKRGAFLALGLGLSVALAGAAIGAQPAPQPRQLPQVRQNEAAPPAARNDTRDGNRTADQRGDRRAAGLERRLGYLHDELRITRAQESLWNSFANAVRDEAQMTRDRVGRGRRDFATRVDRDDRNNDRNAPSVIDRLEQQHQRLVDRSVGLDHLISTVRPLYAALNADQKETADRLLLRAEQRFGRGGFGRANFRRGQAGRGQFNRDQYDRQRFDRDSGRFGQDGPDDRNFDRDYR